MLTYTLDRRGTEPLYVQLYKHIRDDIAASRIEAGSRLPSKRALAAHLGVSVITVEGALAQLAAEGYIEPSPRRGFFACEMRGYEGAAQSPGSGAAADGGLDTGSGWGSGASLDPCTNQEHVIPAHSPSEHTEAAAGIADASAGSGAFPYAAWARTMRRVLSEGDESTLLSSMDGRGTLRLRRAIASHLQGFRGMEVSPEQIVIGSGAQSLYGLLVQLLGRSRTFAIENPGYPRLAQIYRSNDVDLRLIGLDEKGPIAKQLQTSGASVFHCMPSHQFPTGITTTIGRRQELLEWVRQPGSDEQRYLIEDDYDCEFRMSGRPVPPLQAMGESERVIYTNTFTKTLGPAFRIGYMVLPEHLVRRFLSRLGFYACTVGALEQLTLARFIESGEYERHVNRQRTRFRKLQSALTKALYEEAKRADVGHGIKLHNIGAGLHFVISVEGIQGNAAESSRQQETERSIAKRALECGVHLSPLSDYFLDGICGSSGSAEHASGGAGSASAHDDVTTAPVSARASFAMSLASLREDGIEQTASAIVGAVAAAGF